MIRLIVRSKKDADALRAMLENYLPSWEAEVATLKGARKEKILDKVDEVVDPNKFNIILLGREDSEIAKELSLSTPINVLVHVIPRARVRNARLKHMKAELDKAKAQMRAWISWKEEVPYFSKRYPVKVEPPDDPFFAWGLWWKTLGLGEPSSKAFLVFKRAKGFHEIYSRGKVVAMAELPDEDKPSVTPLGEVEGFDLKESVELSSTFLKELEDLTVKALGPCDEAVVPWSAGKDSTAALLIAKRACKRVYAVYVNTGVDMGMNELYVRALSKKLGVELIEAYAPVKENIAIKGLPRREERWCTGLKLEALERTIKELGVDTIIVGDRDAESSSRSDRWAERVWEGVGKVKAPLKLWSAAHVQAYLLWKGIPINPLYPSGFYRLGCYVCPFLRGYERELLKEVKVARLGADERLLELFLSSWSH